MNTLYIGYDIDGVPAPKKLTKAEREEARVKAAGKMHVLCTDTCHFSKSNTTHFSSQNKRRPMPLLPSKLRKMPKRRLSPIRRPRLKPGLKPKLKVKFAFCTVDSYS